jgi:hypothetical protein
VLNALAEAMKAVDGKKILKRLQKSSQAPKAFFPLLQTPATLETLGSISAVMEDVACEMYVLINQLTLVCNMQWNVLDDLAEAMKALDGKKWKMLHANRPCG